MWSQYLKNSGLTINPETNGVKGLLADLEAFASSNPDIQLSKVDKLNIVNGLPSTRGEVFLILGDRLSHPERQEALVNIVKNYKQECLRTAVSTSRRSESK
jgi:hypothetical protein